MGAKLSGYFLSAGGAGEMGVPPDQRPSIPAGLFLASFPRLMYVRIVGRLR
jgi:hypothetical protein